MTTKRKMLHYPECGLDNVYLVNGYRVRRTPYGEAVSIEDVDGLYASIARSLVEKAGALNGKEFRFLRKHLGFSQSRLGEWLGYDEQTVSRWEREKSDIPPAADRLLRGYHREIKQGGAARLRELVTRLTELDDETAEKQLRLKRSKPSAKAAGRDDAEEWKLAA
ncbi:MAG: transcriptional regulator [Proteobacteria bacterium]|nr:transcriptional regulator [Pseudomonadota bacterium]